jgi:hypothetical protein
VRNRLLSRDRPAETPLKVEELICSQLYAVIVAIAIATVRSSRIFEVVRD